MHQDPTGRTLENDPLLVQFFARPQLLPHLLPVWEAFGRLGRRRPVGFGVGAIPMTEFESYCRTFDVNDVERRHWLFVRLDALDAAYIEQHRETQEQKKN